MTGYWERDVAAPRAEDWGFHPTGEPLAGRPLRNPARDTSARGLGRGEELRFRMRADGVDATLERFNVYCSPARLTVRAGGEVTRYRLHHVDGLRQQARGRGLDDVPRTQYGALEGPGGELEDVTVLATRDEVVLEERGWTFERTGG